MTLYIHTGYFNSCILSLGTIMYLYQTNLKFNAMKRINLLKVFALSVIPIALVSCNPNREKSAYILGNNGLIIPDSLITEVVENKLHHFREVPEHLVDVETIDGIVKLTGSISNILAKEKAEEIASAVRGVKGVINELEVRTENVPDQELRNHIINMFNQDPVIKDFNLNVEVNNGHVILTGLVTSWSEEQLALDVAKSVSGVKSVEDRINFSYEKKRLDDEIYADIKGILKYDIYINENSVNVDVKDGKVTLSGNVGSLLEKSRAIADAWVAGVDTITANNLKITSTNRHSMLEYKKYTQMSDPEITDAIEQVLLYDARVNNSAGINVKVNNGNVTLSGSVDNLRAKNTAIADAENVVGVKGVDSRIKVRTLKMQPKKVLVDNAMLALKLDPYLQFLKINVIEENGKIYLNGEVNSYFEKQEAEKAVSKVPGVIEIENNLKLTYHPTLPYPPEFSTSNMPLITEPDMKSDSKIKEDIEKQLWWSPYVSEKDITVKVNKGVARLSGKVDSRLEREYAERNAIEGGAVLVENDLKVKPGLNQ
jgi:osmotically-inducible protein OsmY